MKERTSTLSLWVSDMPRALYVLSSVLRCNIPMRALQLLDRGQRGIQLTARVDIDPCEQTNFQHRLESIVGVMEARLVADAEVATVNPTPVDWNHLASHGARFR